MIDVCNAISQYSKAIEIRINFAQMQPIKHIKSQNKPLNNPAKLSQAQLFEHVKDSTERNRQFFFIWIAFALYVIVTTVATTDLQLLLPNSTVTLPALGIQLPLIGFFLVTPWLVLILHFNLLQNLDSHANKLAEWANTYPSQKPPRAALPAFLFDFAMLEQGGAYTRLTHFAAQLAFYASGPITIAILLWRYSDYQSWLSTVFQALAFVISLALVIKSNFALSVKYRHKVAFSAVNYLAVYIPSMAIVALQTFWVVWLAFDDDNKPLLFDTGYYEIFLPRISIPPNTSLVAFSSDLQIRMAADGFKDMPEWWKKHGRGANLEMRNLKYADLRGSDLRKSQLSGAMLHRASLQQAQLQGATLQNTQLKAAQLIFAQLQGAYLIHTQLHGAQLQGSALQGAWLYGIEVDKTTSFNSAETNETTSIDLTFNLSTINEELTYRKRLRDENYLKLPSILYEQLKAREEKPAEKVLN